MASKLKTLYKYLIGNRKSALGAWHDAYSDFYDQVDQIRKHINSGTGLSHNNDKAFLKKLLFEKSNGIASRGQSVLSEKNFESFIQIPQFISALEALIKNPSKKTLENFGSAWSAQGQGNRPLLVNRVAAACTLTVSTTVDSGKFNQVFSWLIREGMIAPYPINNAQDWYSKNTYLLQAIKNEFSTELSNKDTDEFYLSMFVWEIYANISNPFSLKKQIIKYGSPGTGKTYQARQQTSLLFDIWKEEFAPKNSSFTHASQIELVQFHPSYSYEDFMEGLRPDLNNGTVQLTLQNGVFKEFCRKAGKWEVDVHNLGLDWETSTISDLCSHQKDLGEHWQYIFDLLDEVKPSDTVESSGTAGSSGAVVSKKISDVVPPFFFIIDEVNRAELSRVFGELMYCLEYRGAKGCVKTQYANLNTQDTGMLWIDQGYQFFIPSNVYLIGTMNTIDRSVESFDFALRRRFRWEEVVPDTGLLRYHLKKHCNKWTFLAENLEALNDLIVNEPLLGHDYQIGHAYLMNLKYDTSLTVAEVRNCVWDDCILPLLQEYLRGTGKETELISSFAKAFGG